MNFLIVDDEIEMINGILNGVCWEHLDFGRIFQATGVEKAKEVLRTYPVSLILCDIEMPDGSGLDLLEWVRREYPKIVCLILTCHEDFGYARRAVSIGCRDYILKPVSYGELEEKLKALSGGIRKEQENIYYQNMGRDMVRSIAAKKGEEGHWADKKEMVETVKAYIRTHLREELKAEDLAGKVFITPDYLYRIFKQEEGVTLLDFIVEERMFLAQQLLREGKVTISRAAYECGYDNFSYFTKVFKKRFGVTPKEFKKRI